MTLYVATQELHHACERHGFGSRLAKGEVTPQEYADWLATLALLHDYVDGVCPAAMNRHAGFAADRLELRSGHEVYGTASSAAQDYVDVLVASDEARLGAAYVLHGAHRTGGRIMQATMTAKRLPTWHLYYADHREAKQFVDDLRGRADLQAHSKAAFAVLLVTMTEIGGGGSV